ncbi:MAG: hypothetical protein VX044_08545 [Planctomycetota bacterium]|nr:hypothetical protein [Planctomycetota bacterium]
MPTTSQPHPDRRKATLHQVLASDPPQVANPASLPGIGSADCRIDLKQWIFRARRAMAASADAARHLEPLSEARHPDLWAGTVPDGVARGFAARLEEACSMANCADATPAPEPPRERHDGAALRRKKDLLVAAGAARVRFTRKGGLLFVVRDRDVHTENCLWFEARRDHGTLDGFVGAPDERPRLFSAQHLKPAEYIRTEHTASLTLTGLLGKGHDGWHCRVHLHGDQRRSLLSMTIELPRSAPGWRLRSRLLGVPADLARHACEPVRERVDGPRGGFLADTLIRSCGVLRVGEDLVEAPAAAAPGPLVHQFELGPATR